MHVGDLLSFYGYVIALLLFHLLELREVPHEPIVLVLVELEFLLLCLARPLPLLQLHRVLVHRVPVQELLVARHTDLAPSFTSRVVHRVRPRLVETRAAVQGPTELTRKGLLGTNILPMLEFLVGLDAVVALSRVHIAFILRDLITQLKYAVLLMKEHVVVILDLDLSNFLCNSLVILMHLIALGISEFFKRLEFLVPYRQVT